MLHYNAQVFKAFPGISSIRHHLLIKYDICILKMIQVNESITLSNSN